MPIDLMNQMTMPEALQAEAMSDTPIVCVIDNDRGVRESVHLFLADHGFEVRTHPSATSFSRGWKRALQAAS